MVFGSDNEKGIRLDGLTPEVVELGREYSKDDLWVHDEKDTTKANLLARFFEHPAKGDHLTFPRPFGVLYAVDRPTYDDGVAIQNAEARKRSEPDLDALLQGPEIWEVT
jgi:2-oxoglutarate ferredoxin oxidoreductase subunit beta